MSTIITRQGKGTPLTNAELDANFTNLNTDKLEAGALSPYLLSATAASTYAPLASPTLTGTPAAPTAAADTNTTQIATTAYVIGQGYLKSATASSTYLPLSGGALTGNLTFGGTGRRIIGDFSNATVANRAFFQTSTTDGNTLVGVLPNGTSANSQLHVYGSSDPTNAPFGTLTINATTLQLQSTATGSGTALPLRFMVGATESHRVDTSGRVLVGLTSNQSGDKLQVSGLVWSDTGFTSYGTAGSVFTANANSTGAINAIFQNTGGNLYVGRDSSSGGTFGVANAHVLWGSGASNPMVFGVASAERFRFGTAGQLGIGGANYGTSGQAFISGGASAAPSWGTLGTGAGGTGLTSFTANGVVYASSTSALATGSTFVFDGTNVGIGTSSPSTYGKFAVSSTGTPTTAYASILSGTGTYNAAFESTLYLGAARTDVVDNGVVVGWRFKTYSANAASGAYLSFESANSATGAFAPPATYTERARISSDGTFRVKGAGTAGSTDAVQFSGSAPASAMTLDSSGNLGVGTTNPGARLHAEGTGPIQALLRTTGASSYTSLRLYNDQNAAGRALEIDYFGSTASGGERAEISTTGAYPLCFLTSNTERARITSGGNLLVGSTGGSANLTVYGSADDIQKIYSTQASGPTRSLVSMWSDATTPSSPTGTLRVNITTNGGIANYQANDSNLSDRREKTNFAPAGDYLSKICAIPVQTFNYIDQNLEEDAGLTLGVVAQDVQAVAPELVMESDWGTKDSPKMRLSIYQTDLQYALMKCIQELKAEVDSLKAQLKGN